MSKKNLEGFIRCELVAKGPRAAVTGTDESRWVITPDGPAVIYRDGERDEGPASLRLAIEQRGGRLELLVTTEEAERIATAIMYMVGEARR